MNVSGNSRQQHTRWIRHVLPMVLALSSLVRGGQMDSSRAATHGMIEIGLSGSMIYTESLREVRINLRTGLQARLSASALIKPTLLIGYRHIRSLDVLRLEAQPEIVLATGNPSVAIALSPAAGIEREWVGSFRTNRYPVGAGAGVITFLSPRAALRIDYAFRRILGDPVADFSEHQLLVGLSVFVGNSGSRHR